MLFPILGLVGAAGAIISAVLLIIMILREKSILLPGILFLVFALMVGASVVMILREDSEPADKSSGDQSVVDQSEPDKNKEDKPDTSSDKSDATSQRTDEKDNEGERNQTKSVEPESDSSVQFSIPNSVTYSGNGDDVVTLDKFDDVFVFHIVGNHVERHFAVKGFDSNGESTELLVNTTSKYDGITMDPTQETAILEVKATGEWTIEVQSIHAMKTISIGETLSGSGDSVVLVSSYGSTAIISGNEDGSHFAVKSYGKERDKLLVNTTDPYEGKVMLAGEPIILDINAEGAWTISFE